MRRGGLPISIQDGEGERGRSSARRYAVQSEKPWLVLAARAELDRGPESVTPPVARELPAFLTALCTNWDGKLRRGLILNTHFTDKIKT